MQKRKILDLFKTYLIFYTCLLRGGLLGSIQNKTVLLLLFNEIFHFVFALIAALNFYSKDMRKFNFRFFTKIFCDSALITYIKKNQI